MKSNKSGHNRTARSVSVFISVAVAFAMAFTLFPVSTVSAGNENDEPTLPASDMVSQDNEGDQPGDVDGEGEGDENTSESTTDETSSTDGTSETTTESTSETTTTIATTTINTSGKKWKTPKGNKTLSLTLCHNTDGTVFDLTSQAGQKLFDYDTLQGATAGKGYAYFALYNRKVDKAKIVKVRLTDMEVVKVSGALNVKHANELTYNGRKNIIVVANSDPAAKRLSIINANTLTLVSQKKISVSHRISGMSKKQRKKFKGVGAIAYNEKHNCYVCRMRKTNDILLLNSKFKPYKRIRQKSRLSGLLYQGMDSYKDCIMICQSFKGKKKYNVITVYNMKGKFLARFKMKIGSPPHEMETVFHNGNQFYAGFYMSYKVTDSEGNPAVMRKNLIYMINNL
ncbi:MAG: hypothetical protein ACSW8G_03840 [Bacillota bacterium]